MPAFLMLDSHLRRTACVARSAGLLYRASRGAALLSDRSAFALHQQSRGVTQSLEKTK
jgi:hypothetical protein